MQETWVSSLGWEDPVSEDMGTHSSILAWEIPWTEEPLGLQSMGWQRVRHSWARTHTWLIRRWQDAQYCYPSEMQVKSTTRSHLTGTREAFMLSGRSEAQKATGCQFHLDEMYKTYKSIEIESGLVVSQAGWREWGVSADGNRVPWGGGNAWELDSGDVCTTLWIY